MNQKEYQKSPKGKYITQRANAHWRGIPWQFTFDTWWTVWERSGKWAERGNHPGQYFMCRTGNVGHYGPDNVRINTISANALEAWQIRKAAALVPAVDPFEIYPRQTAWDYSYTSDWLRFSRQTALKESTLKESA